MGDAEPEERERAYAVRVNARARADIDAEYARLAALSGMEIAEDWEEGLYEALGTLARFPERRVTAEESGMFSVPVRQYVYRRRRGSPAHRILFTVHEEGPDGPFLLYHARPPRGACPHDGTRSEPDRGRG
jgi:plasmid stabilization system protein ParE